MVVDFVRPDGAVCGLGVAIGRIWDGVGCGTSRLRTIVVVA